jgi:hypothetical protein
VELVANCRLTEPLLITVAAAELTITMLVVLVAAVGAALMPKVMLVRHRNLEQQTRAAVAVEVSTLAALAVLALSLFVTRLVKD